MSTALLDVNVLIALFDQGHVHHQIAHKWFEAQARSKWATCPLTANGCMRILSQGGYTRAQTPLGAAEVLRIICSRPNHEFWPDSISLLDENIFSLTQVESGKQLTDIYLLGLAVRRGGKLVTFDRSIPWQAVIGAKKSDLHVLGAPVR
ncbi:MAG: TA system VapC family ribonuclease toxin [Acidobacteriota bacterium]